MAEPYYITTAIHYPNGKPHIGHAYETIAADVAARFQRLMGREVRFQTGTDEHGLKMAQKARELGITPRQLADEMSNHFRALFDRLDISYDRFFRTTEDEHHRASQAIWRAMEANGDLYLDRYEGWYSVRDEAYYDESELIEGEGGEKLSPQGTPVEWTVEESWFFRLSKYQEPLLALYRDNPEFVRPASRLNEVRSFVEGGLRDLSVSRTSFDWGVKVPGAAEHVMYGWACHVCLGRCAHQLPDRPGLSRRNARNGEVLARRRASDRQGHRPLPRGLLAGVPDERRHRPAEAGLWPRLHPQPRAEGIEVAWQRDRSA